MFGIVFLWTPPHFWALALMIKRALRERRASRCCPVVRGERETARQIVWYTVALVVATLVPVALRHLRRSPTASRPLVLGAVFAWYRARALARRSSGRTAVKLFHFSMLYLALLFVAMALDAVI